MVGIDIEPDAMPDWTYKAPLSFEATHDGLLKRLVPLFLKLGIRPTFFVNNVLMEENRVVDALLSIRDCELANHLHGDFIEPSRTWDDAAGKPGRENQSEYPPDVERGKLENSTAFFEKNFGRRPLSFRAGRFAVRAETFRILEELGYLADSSVTPCLNWDPVRNFSRAPLQPYFPNTDILSSGGHGRVIELPITIRKACFPRPRFDWLRPTHTDSKRMFKLIARTSSEKSPHGPPLLNFMLHNVDIMPGMTYAKNEADSQALLNSLESSLKYALELGGEPLTASESARRYKA